MERTALMLPATWGEEPVKSACRVAPAGSNVEADCDLDGRVGDAIVVEEILSGKVTGGHRAQLRADETLRIVQQLVNDCRRWAVP